MQLQDRLPSVQICVCQSYNLQISLYRQQEQFKFEGLASLLFLSEFLVLYFREQRAISPS